MMKITAFVIHLFILSLMTQTRAPPPPKKELRQVRIGPVWHACAQPCGGFWVHMAAPIYDTQR
jgi:hypothetical protein